MPKLTPGNLAIDFELKDTSERLVRLSSYRGKKRIVLVLMRGFYWPYCRAHLAQLRLEYDKFVGRNAEIIALGPDGPNAFKKYWANEKIPFIGLADIHSRVAKKYYQEVNLIKAGRMPALMVIDLEGRIVYSHYGDSMRDIPPNAEVFKVLDEIP